MCQGWCHVSQEISLEILLAFVGLYRPYRSEARAEIMLGDRSGFLPQPTTQTGHVR